ncbi:MAG: aminoacyl-tRNA hydrolase [Candidatus Saccharibacteria bacterium]
MALFQKRPQVSNPVQFTTVGLNKSLLIVGLGNPGEEYADTRHNVGFMCLDDFARKNDFQAWTHKKDLKCELTQQTLGDTRVILIKPQTFMNLSGEAVQAVQHFYKLHNGQTVVVHDELDVNFGQIRMRIGGSAAGNNGIKSVSQHIGEDYGRVRIGIGPKVPRTDGYGGFRAAGLQRGTGEGSAGPQARSQRAAERICLRHAVRCRNP